MPTTFNPSAPASPRTRTVIATRAGWTLTSFVVLFLAFDGVIKLLDLPVVQQTSTQLGLPPSNTFGLGVLTLAIAVLYAVPRTAVLGALLLTGLLGGAVATHLRVGSPVFSHLLFGVYVGVFAWGGLWLRDPRVRALLPWRH